MTISNIEGRLVNTKANKEMLNNLIHRDFLDLSIYYEMVVERNNDYMKVIKVSYDIAKQHGWDEDDLYKAAVSNIKSASIINMSAHSVGLRMVALTNEFMSNGAFYIMSTKILDNLAYVWGVNKIIIIPSSIHEVILVPLSESSIGMIPEWVNGIIRSINDTEVKEEEVLSDHAYLYSAETKQYSSILNSEGGANEMDDTYKEVYFGQYCSHCKHSGKEEDESPCDECLSETANLYSHKPVNWEAKDGEDNYLAPEHPDKDSDAGDKK